MYDYENSISEDIERLLNRGATIINFQEFISPEQVYKTVLIYQTEILEILHKKPLSFIIQPNKQIIKDSEIPKPFERYHPS